MGFRTDNIVTSDQTHTCNVRKVTEKDRGKGIVTPRDYTDIDGMITNVPSLVLATFYADCVPLYFVDLLHHAIGLSHSGWRGTVQKIGEVTIKKMAEEYGSNPKDMKVAIGPSICQDCYEVSLDVIEEFKNAFDQKHWDKLFMEKIMENTSLISGRRIGLFSQKQEYVRKIFLCRISAPAVIRNFFSPIEPLMGNVGILELFLASENKKEEDLS